MRRAVKCMGCPRPRTQTQPHAQHPPRNHTQQAHAAASSRPARILVCDFAARHSTQTDTQRPSTHANFAPKQLPFPAHSAAGHQRLVSAGSTCGAQPARRGAGGSGTPYNGGAHVSSSGSRSSTPASPRPSPHYPHPASHTARFPPRAQSPMQGASSQGEVGKVDHFELRTFRWGG